MTLFVHRPAQAAFRSLRGMMPKVLTVSCRSQAHIATAQWSGLSSSVHYAMRRAQISPIASASPKGVCHLMAYFFSGLHTCSSTQHCQRRPHHKAHMPTVKSRYAAEHPSWWQTTMLHATSTLGPTRCSTCQSCADTACSW